ncbi:MAG: SgcJ/EcaC family oxidoreductase, partial [Acidobacteria bacterium]|nr:SgcJ/EcaC family oxidoreductase [Acidobacteriota bacterium]
MLQRFGLLALACALLGSAFGSLSFARNGPAASDKLTAEDRAAIRALDATFVEGWLKDDAKAVLSVFADDAVLLPPGNQPLNGIPAIRAYWWPQDGSRTLINAFDRRIDEIEGTRQLAFMRGTASLSWTYEKDGRVTKQTSRSIDLMLLTRDAAGRWRVIRQMWNTL